MENKQLAQVRIQQLYSRNAQIELDIQTLQSGDEKRRKYVLAAGIAGVAVYSLMLIFIVSIIDGGGLDRVFGFFLSWTVIWTLTVAALAVPVYRLRKHNKQINEEIAACQAEIRRNLEEIVRLRKI